MMMKVLIYGVQVINRFFLTRLNMPIPPARCQSIRTRHKLTMPLQLT